MAKSNHTKESREAIRQAALARHAARREALAVGAPTPAPYIMPPDPPAPEPVVVPDPVAVPAVATTIREELMSAPVTSLAPLGPPPPQLAFAAWLRSREGVDANDTRMSRDGVRFGVELEDRLRIAWMAGYLTGRAEA